MPDPSMLTFHVNLGAAELVWCLSVTVELPLWPDWTARVPLAVVRPSAALAKPGPMVTFD